MTWELIGLGVLGGLIGGTSYAATRVLLAALKARWQDRGAPYTAVTTLVEDVRAGDLLRVYNHPVPEWVEVNATERFWVRHRVMVRLHLAAGFDPLVLPAGRFLPIHKRKTKA